MSHKPKIAIDWEDGEATLTMGRRFNEMPLTARLDIIDDIARDLEAIQIGLMEESGLLGEVEARRLADNRARRDLCTRLQGARIEHAEALPNGHVALTLHDGTVLAIMGDRDGAVIIEEVESLHVVQAIATADAGHRTTHINEMPVAAARH